MDTQIRRIGRGVEAGAWRYALRLGPPRTNPFNPILGSLAVLPGSVIFFL